MGCFLGCFGSSKDVKKRPKTSHITSNQYPVYQNQYNPTCPIVTSTVIANQDPIKTPINLLVSQTRTKPEDEQELSLTSKDKFDEPIQLSSGTQKKVTFDTNIQEYEHVSSDDPQEDLQDSRKGGEKDVIVECSIEPIKSSSESEGGSTLSSLGLFPPNHRYQNCRESDDEDEGLDCEVSEFDEEEEDDDGEYSDDEFYLREGNEVSARPCLSVESKTGSSPTYMANDGYNDQDTLDKEKSPAVFNRVVRDRAGYVLSVLNPVENTAQWKAVKVKGTPTPPMKEQKENFLEDFGFEQSSTNPKSKLDGLAKQDHEVAVDASLSTWLASSLKTPPSKGTPMSLAPILSGSSVSSKGSNSVTTQEERQIFGSSTVEKIKQFSDTPFPRRRSPDRSPDGRPVADTVEVQLNDKTPVEECGSVSSFKGIPNSTSKYREDQKVKWHSTPFETRLERALDRGGAKCDATRRAC